MASVIIYNDFKFIRHIVKFKKNSKTAVVIIAGVTISRVLGAPFLRPVLPMAPTTTKRGRPNPCSGILKRFYVYYSSKTEFLLIGTKQQRLKFSYLTNLSLSNDIIPVSSSARNLGFIFDSDMSFSEQINSVSKSCHFHIRDIRRIRHLLPLSAATALANSLVSSNLDYCNSLYSGISQSNLNKLQRIQNSLARVITNTSKYQHITPTLKKLHWLPIKQRIDYKLCLLTYKTLTNQQPTYLYNSLSFPSHSVSTRSSDSLVLSIPYVRSSLGKRAFSVIGPRLWNSLPPDTRNSNSLPTFRSRLKTHLFKIAFPP